LLAPHGAAEASTLLGALAPELVKLLPELSLLLPALQPSPPLEPAAEKHRLFESLIWFVSSLAAARPVLIVLEDLQWSDEQSLELLLSFVRRISAIPILILGTYQSEESDARLAHYLNVLHREHLADEIQLGPLARPEVAQMAQAILRVGPPIPSDWLDRLMPLTEGNPFFVEEMTKSLAQAAAQPVQAAQVPIPRSIQHAMRRRAAALPAAAQSILSMAAVIGERFDFALLQAVAGADERALLQSLKDMIAAQLVVEQSADRFAFRHAITREAVYAALLQRERRALHRTIGQALERLAGPLLDAPAAPLAYHFYQAGDWPKALEYSQLAGEKAQALYAPREALAHFSHALDAARHLAVALPLAALRGRAQAYDVLGDFDAARADLDAALALASRRNQRVEEWQSLIDLGLLWQSHDLERAGRYYQRALELARDLEDESVLAPTLNRVGNWHFNRGCASEALPYHRQALALF
jgi:predicted ATPase